jgi:hypothetical protein
VSGVCHCFAESDTTALYMTLWYHPSEVSNDGYGPD